MAEVKTEEIKEYYPNGSLKAEGKQLISEGWKRSYIEGPPEALGIKISRWKYYYEGTSSRGLTEVGNCGAKKGEEFYTYSKDYQDPINDLEFFKSVLDGRAISWYENGQKQSEATYKSGTLVGKKTDWYENGQVSSIYEIKAGKDKWTEYYTNGNVLREKYYKRNQLYEVEWSPDGKKSYIKKNGLPMANNWRCWHENGQLHKEIFYKKQLVKHPERPFGLGREKLDFVDGDPKGKPRSKEKAWYPGGQKKAELIFEENYIHDGQIIFRPKGRVWDENGDLIGQPGSSGGFVGRIEWWNYPEIDV